MNLPETENTDPKIWGEIMDFCPCETCVENENGKLKKCLAGHTAKLKRNEKVFCPDWDEGEIDE